MTRHALAIAAIVLVLPQITAAAPLTVGADTADIQPGAALAGGCALNFVFDSYHETGPHVGKVWIGTLARCAGELGGRAALAKGGEFGTFVWKGDFDGVERNGIPGLQLDYALIEVDDAREADVSAEVMGIPGTPRDYSRAGATGACLTCLRFAGPGEFPGGVAPPQEARLGGLRDDNVRTYRAIGFFLEGDAGGPIIYNATLIPRAALGAVGVFNASSGEHEGPTIEGVRRELIPLGWPLSLRSAPWIAE